VDIVAVIDKLSETIPSRAYINIPKWWWHDNFGEARAMCISEGYVMMRRPGSTPFIVCEKDLILGNTSFRRLDVPLT